MEKGNLADSDGSKDSSLESNEFRSYGRNDGTFLKEVKGDVKCVVSIVWTFRFFFKFFLFLLAYIVT